MALYDVIGRDYTAHRAADRRIGDRLVRLLDLTPGANLWVSWQPGAAHLLPGETG